MSREAHLETVAAAIQAIGDVGHYVTDLTEKRREIFESIALLKEKQEQALAMVAMAVGDDPGTNSGRNSLEFTMVLGQRTDELNAIVATLDERIQELARICDNTTTELNQYLNGF